MVARICLIAPLVALAACSQPVKQLPDDMQASWVDAERQPSAADAAALVRSGVLRSSHQACA